MNTERFLDCHARMHRRRPNYALLIAAVVLGLLLVLWLLTLFSTP